MKTVLTINTASDQCAVALLCNGQLSERTSAAQRQSAQRVLPMIAELLQEAGISLAALDLIAVVAGPGSFTGVRIGVSVAQGLSFAHSIPVVALSSLALTAMVLISDQAASKVLVSEEAREGEIYFAAYKRSEALGVELLGVEQVATVAALRPLPLSEQSANWHLAGNGWSRQNEILQQLACSADAQPSSPLIPNRVIVQLAQLQFACGRAVAAELLRPNYVKEQLDYS
jgi:tRNA threonylcarbamoyladenosine biosynthesis protein TsaB